MYRVIVLLLASLYLVNAQQAPLRAVAMISGGLLNPRNQQPVMIFGDVKFSQTSPQAPLLTRLNITFFPSTDSIANQARGVHIHNFGVSDTQSCLSTGTFSNVKGADLAITTVQPVNGRLFTDISTPGLNVQSIIGKSIVIHEDVNGRGDLIGCGTIGILNPAVIV